MNLQRNPEFDMLAQNYGIVLPEAMQYFPEGLSAEAAMALDAQPALVTISNSGIPSYLSNYIDPALIEVLVTPNRAAQIFGEAKKGDWVTNTATFPVIENTGEVSSYGDYNENGSAGANANFPQRQAYHYQTMTQWGEKQLETYSLAKIDYASRLNIASAVVLGKFQNNSYFFGIAGLQNYGLLNDPQLAAPIAPGAKVFNSNLPGPWVTNGQITASSLEIYNDIQALFLQLTSQSGGLIEMDDELILAMSPVTAVALTQTNATFATNVMDLIKKNFPKIRVETASQYTNPNGAGNLVQMIAPSVEGQETGFCAFTEKMRAHAIVRKTSSFLQKKSQGTWGAVVRQPFAIAQLVGV
jgi:hypothetical protein